MSAPFARASRSFAAKWPGICEECQEGFEQGEEVRYQGSDLAHADPDDCVKASWRPLTGKPCGKCFLVHAGDCF